ncbi:MAG: carboxypeptidase regulatory-like domain-containing protein [Bacteroidales bacterium]|nr:carboxypeptidase regulatory-like domain-containing protein [Bacteroidales bacterium]
MKVFLLLVSSLYLAQGIAQNKKMLVEQLNKRGEAYVLIKLPDKKTIYRLNKVVSIDRESTLRKNYVYAYVSKSQFDEFNLLGLDYSVQTAPSLKLAATMCPDLTSVKNWNCYPTYNQYIDLLIEFATNYPNLCKLDTIGTSVTGRLIPVLKISDNVSLDEEEPAFFYSSTMHGDEVTGYVLMLRLIDYLLSNYQNDARVKKLIDSTEIWINPLANPDGTYSSGNTDITGATRANANGIDLNRDFPYPGNENSPYQKETQDMMSFMEKHHFILASNFHGGAEVVNYPWDTWSTRHADDDWYIKISRQYADTAQANSTGYMTDLQNGITNGYDWYPIAGGRQDYANYYLHSRETTIELSSTKLPDASSLPAFWEYNYRSLLNYIDRVHFGIYGKITDTEGNPVRAKISIENHDADSSEVYSNPENGMYYRMIAGGTYNITYSASGYDSLTKSNVLIGDDEQIRIDVVLEKNVSSVPFAQIKQVNNPFGNSLNLNLYLEKNTDKIILSLFDLSGRKQKEYSLTNLFSGDNFFSINTSGLSKGLYLMKISSKQFVIQKKLIKN